MTEPSEPKKYIPFGSKTPEGRARQSLGPFRHGARKAELIFKAGREFSGPLKEIRDGIIADNSELREMIEQGGFIGDEANRYADAETVRRAWMNGLKTATDWDRAGYFSRFLGTWTGITHQMWQGLLERRQAEKTIDVGDVLNG